MALLLWVAGILAFVSGTPQLGWAIWAVIWINALFSFWQEFQAEQALAMLKNVLPMQVKAYRNGQLQVLPARELVPGDVIELEEGDRISADARLVSSQSFYVDVSVLTGESMPVPRSSDAVTNERYDGFGCQEENWKSQAVDTIRLAKCNSQMKLKFPTSIYRWRLLRFVAMHD
jgi:Ca2+-transporting ATPase